MSEITYADSGVNIELGDDASKVLYNAAKQTWKNRKVRIGEVITPFDDFTGLRAVDISKLPEGSMMGAGSDGVGTKIEIAERTGNHAYSARNLIAMVADDAVVRGAEPIVVTSVLDVNSLQDTTEAIRKIARGYIDAARDANVAVINGETAELGERVRGYSKLPGFFRRLSQSWKYLTRGDLPAQEGFAYNWGATCIWFARKERLFTGMEIKEGDYIVGLREHGFRSNGISLVRKVLANAHGREWHTRDWKDGMNLGETVEEPSKIYTKAVVDMFGGFEGTPKAQVHGVAHITGGGVPGKLGRILRPSRLSAVIDNPFEPSEFVRYVQELGNVLDAEAYKTWNMGQGMLVITPEPDKVVAVAGSYGIKGQRVGIIEPTKDKPRITISNRGVYSSREPELVFGIE